MNIVWRAIGRVLFWLSWPALVLYLSRGTRTRVLVRSGDKVLVVKTWLGNGKWGLPGGGLHASEPPRDGAIRELREETGLVLRATALVEYGKLTYRQNGLHFDYYAYSADTPVTVPLRRQPFEMVDVQWKTLAELTAWSASTDVLRALELLRPLDDLVQ